MMFPLVALHAVTEAEGNGLLADWGHPLGACRRPFRQDFHALFVEGVAVGLTVGASTVSATVGGFRRDQVVELARIARHPAEPWVLRPLLRLWREVVAPSWPCWPVAALVSYAMPGTPGAIYRFDGWRRVGRVRPSTGGGTWSSAPAVNTHADGIKTLWVYDRPILPAPTHPHRGGVRVEAPAPETQPWAGENEAAQADALHDYRHGLEAEQ